MTLMKISFPKRHSAAASRVVSRQLAPAPKATPVEQPTEDVRLSEAANPKLKSFQPNHSDVYKSALRLAATLASLNIPSAIAGGLAVGAHGYQRSTRDVDVVLTPDGLDKLKSDGLGRGIMERYKGSRNLKDTISKVDIDVILTTDKPVPVPDPATSSVTNADGLKVLSLPSLIELKLSTASPERKKDVKDVSGLIWTNGLDADYAELLDPSVRERFLELVGQEEKRWNS